MKKIKFLAFLLPVILFGCHKSIPVIKATDIKSESIEIPLNDSATAEKIYPQTKNFTFNNVEYLAYLPVNRDSVYLYNLQSLKKEKAFKIPHIKGGTEISDFYMLSLDSSVFLSSNTNSIILANSKGSFKQYYLKDAIPTYKTNYVLSPPLSVVNNFIVASVYPQAPVVGAEERDKYFSSLRDVILKVNDSVINIVKQTCSFPEIYRENYFYSYNPVRTIVNNELIYSFEISENIEIFNLNDFSDQVKTLELFKFKKRTPFDENKLMDYSYVGNYLHEADRYFALLYDPYQKKYIRIQQLGSDEKLDKEGNVNSLNEFNILIYDNNFKLEKVIQFPADEKYDFRKVLLTKKGLLIKKNVPEILKFKIQKYEQFKLY